MKSIASLLLLASIAFALPSTVSAQAPDDRGVRVLRSDATGLELEITPRVVWSTVDGGLLHPRVDGAMMINEDATGAPIDLRMVLPVALPGIEGTRMEVSGIEYGAAIDGRLVPVPTLVEDAEGISSEVYRVDPDAYRAAMPTGQAVTFEYGGIARGVHVGRIVVAPIRYVPATDRIEVVTKIRLTLRFAGSPFRSGSPVDLMPGMNSGLLNGRQAAFWSSAPSTGSFARPAAPSNARAWFRVTVGEAGLYAIEPEDFQSAGIDPSSVRNVAVYGGKGTPLPEAVDSALLNQMLQVPTLVERSGDRVTRVVFYGAAHTGWEFRAFDVYDSIPRRVNNPYSGSSSYIVAIDGDPARPFPQAEGLGAPQSTPTYGLAHLLVEEDLTNAIAQGNSGIGGGRDWFGSSFVVDEFRPEEKRLFPHQLAGLERSYPLFYRVRVAHFAQPGGRTGTFSVEQNGQSIGTPIQLYGFSNEHQTAVATDSVFMVDANTIPSDNKGMLGLTYRFPEDATGYLDWFEVHYARKLQAIGNTISFDAPTGSGIAEYRITEFNSNDLIGLDVTDPRNPIRLSPVETNGGTYAFRGLLSDDPKARRSYYVGSPANAKRVTDVTTVRYAGLRATPRSADILVITHEDLRSVAEEYAAYRNQGGEHSATVVTTEEIYTEFSNGMVDPTAIRDYVAHAYHNWPVRPRYLLIIGDANYDYRGIGATQKQYVPLFTSRETNSYNDITVSVYDDYYVRVDGNDHYIDMAPGRIPVTSIEDGETVVEKIKSYENQSGYGEWRQRVIMAADDAAPLGEGGGFVPQAETLEREYLPHWMSTEKIYLPEYPTVHGARDTKPEATQDLLQWFNRGALVVNWVGHGNARVWGHENLLVKDEFIPQTTNDTMLSMVIAVTCNFGRFDNPNEESGAEMFLTHKKGGASVVLATTRAVYIDQNRELMEAYFKSIFLRDTVTKRFLPLGDALMATKLRAGGSRDNDQKYMIFGDPSMRLKLPQDSVEITTVNTVNVATDTALITALSLVTVEGAIRDRSGAIMEGFNGRALVSLYDADREITMNDVDGRVFLTKDKGGLLFHGPTAVTNGRYSAQFRVPKDIAYDSTRTGRIYVYADDNSIDAIGSTCNVIIYGSDTGAIADGDGPDLDIFLDDRTFRSGDVVTPTPMLIIDMEDGSGINATGAGIGHHIEAWIDDNPTPVDLTDFYATSPTDFRKGNAERELLDLAVGEHKVRVRAWDIFNNPAEATAYFRIVEGEPTDLVVTDVVNYPNPMGKQTDFLFRHNQSQPLDVRVDIFTSAGRSIKRLESNGVTDRFVRVPWDGRDADGRRVGNGVYFYRLRVTLPAEGDRLEQVVEVLEKVAVVQ